MKSKPSPKLASIFESTPQKPDAADLTHPQPEAKSESPAAKSKPQPKGSATNSDGSRKPFASMFKSAAASSSKVTASGGASRNAEKDEKEQDVDEEMYDGEVSRADDFDEEGEDELDDEAEVEQEGEAAVKLYVWPLSLRPGIWLITVELRSSRRTTNQSRLPTRAGKTASREESSQS